ncbi:4-phosphoerythronate dehydrogenase PdxB [Prolixibacteraceae bacterium JC049]|nr:4-phosphoerythronate dehydrogenase PdxB [Prolixibacteraceae bacterium JC049]
MKIIVDNKIPYIKGALEPFAEVIYLPGSETTPAIVKEVDALITRTRTICNSSLLENSNVRMIATATIGFDHIDTNYCAEKGIEWTNAPGCNSSSVEQYVIAALCQLSVEQNFSLRDKTIGIVGVGNVGKKVARVATLFGMKVLLNDPPRAREEGDSDFVDLATIQQEADIITLHTPLNRSGEDCTFHLADESFFSALKKQPILLNTCRGEVVKTEALKKAIVQKQVSGAVIDCWEQEPNIDMELLEMVDIATPHIAGYSRDGKANGTAQSVQTISRFFDLGIDNWRPEAIEEPAHSEIALSSNIENQEEEIKRLILHTYPILDDDKRLRKSISDFEKQRGDYPVRREYLAYSVTNCNDENMAEILQQLGFKI